MDGCMKISLLHHMADMAHHNFSNDLKTNIFMKKVFRRMLFNVQCLFKILCIQVKYVQ